MNFDNKIIIGTLTALLASGGITVKEINLDEAGRIVDSLKVTGERTIKTLEPFAREGKRIAEQMLRNVGH